MLETTEVSPSSMAEKFMQEHKDAIDAEVLQCRWIKHAQELLVFHHQVGKIEMLPGLKEGSPGHSVFETGLKGVAHFLIDDTYDRLRIAFVIGDGSIAICERTWWGWRMSRPTVPPLKVEYCLPFDKKQMYWSGSGKLILTYENEKKDVTKVTIVRGFFGGWRRRYFDS